MKLLFTGRAFFSGRTRWGGFFLFLTVLVGFSCFYISQYWFWTGRSFNYLEPVPRDGRNISWTARTTESSRIDFE